MAVLIAIHETVHARENHVRRISQVSNSRESFRPIAYPARLVSLIIRDYRIGSTGTVRAFVIVSKVNPDFPASQRCVIPFTAPLPRTQPVAGRGEEDERLGLKWHGSFACIDRNRNTSKTNWATFFCACASIRVEELAGKRQGSRIHQAASRIT